MYFLLKVGCMPLLSHCHYTEHGSYSNCIQSFTACRSLWIPDDVCWDYVSSEMVRASSPHPTTQLSNPGDVNTFISMLAQNVAEFPKNEVCMRKFVNEA